jgi:hypothetical protein
LLFGKAPLGPFSIMHVTPRSRVALVFSFIALLSACSPKQSPETRHYLGQVTAAIDQFNHDLSQETAPQAPQVPEILKADTPAETVALLQTSKDISAYYAAAGKTIDRVSAICDQIQKQVHGLDMTGVDAAAVEFCDRYAGLTDRRVQLAVNLEAFKMAQQNALSDGRISRYAPKLLAAGLATLLAPTAGAAGGIDFKPSAEEKSEMNSQARSVQDAIVQWQSEAVAVTAAWSDLRATLKAKYPGDDWDFLSAK